NLPAWGRADETGRLRRRLRLRLRTRLEGKTSRPTLVWPESETPFQRSSMRVRLARAAKTTRFRSPRADRRWSARAGTRSEDGKFFRETRGTTMRADRPPPIRRTHEHLAVFGAVLTMKFVNRHDSNIVIPQK